MFFKVCVSMQTLTQTHQKHKFSALSIRWSIWRMSIWLGSHSLQLLFGEIQRHISTSDHWFDARQSCVSRVLGRVWGASGNWWWWCSRRSRTCTIAGGRLSTNAVGRITTAYRSVGFDRRWPKVRTSSISPSHWLQSNWNSFCSTGDPSETEVDTILLLTDDHYLVAEYDSNLDKIVRFEKVPLTNVTLIEFGSVQQSKMFQGSSIAHLCLRINYSVDDVEGYFHMLRSPNIRFFNNVAVVIKTQEEIIGESEKSDSILEKKI